MVSKSSHERKAILVVIIVLILSIFVGLFFGKFLKSHLFKEEPAIIVEPEPEPEPEPEFTPIDLQPVVDTWAASAGGNRSVIVYDTDRAEFIAQYNVNEKYNTASLYKLFVVYEGYRRVENGMWDKNAIATGGKTIEKCLDLAIRESHSPCAETLWAKIGHAELDQIVKNDFGIDEAAISNLTSDAVGIFKIMQRFLTHPDLTDESWAKIKDSMLNQPVTTYNWRQGLPSGFSDKVDVYNKVGWAWGTKDWNIYHDAAILYFKELDRKFIVVVMTNHVSNQKIAELGTKIEQAVYAALESQ